MIEPTDEERRVVQVLLAKGTTLGQMLAIEYLKDRYPGYSMWTCGKNGIRAYTADQIEGSCSGAEPTCTLTSEGWDAVSPSRSSQPGDPANTGEGDTGG
jgi:hypothetical protein